MIVYSILNYNQSSLIASFQDVENVATQSIALLRLFVSVELRFCFDNLYFKYRTLTVTFIADIYRSWLLHIVKPHNCVNKRKLNTIIRRHLVSHLNTIIIYRQQQIAIKLARFRCYLKQKGRNKNLQSWLCFWLTHSIKFLFWIILCAIVFFPFIKLVFIESLDNSFVIKPNVRSLSIIIL